MRHAPSDRPAAERTMPITEPESLNAVRVGPPPGRHVSGIGPSALVVALVVALLVTLRAISPLPSAFLQIAVLIWFAIPGAVLARRLYAQSGGLSAALLAGPAWGYAFSSLGLLVLWAAGVRSFAWLMAAPLLATIVTWPAARLAPLLSLPRFTRGDLAPWTLVALSVPVIVGLPFAHVGRDLPEGRAYRAYFTADFVWQMAVVSEVSKGDMPPRNPYHLDDDLRYYWLTHLLPAAEHRAAGRRQRLEPLLLVDALWVAMAFVGFFYFFVRHFVERPWAAALACVGVVFCSSFEGAHQIWSLWQRGRPLAALRGLNIDAISRWVYQGMPIDGLHRLLLYQPQHQLGYLLGFSALLLVIQARDCCRPTVLFMAGVFLGLAVLMSPFGAGMLTIVVAAYVGWRIVQFRRWRALAGGALAAAPILAALAASRLLGYVDPASTLARVGMNLVAIRAWQIAIFLSFGPVLLIAFAGLVMAWRQGALGRFVAIGIALTVCTIFYFLVDVPDVQGVYVGWHVGKIAFIAFAPLCGFALQEVWARSTRVRMVGCVLLAAVAIAAVPTVVIDVYNTQDIWNRGPAPGFRWTVLLSPDEVQGLDWIRQWTPMTARVQVEPNVRGRDTWAYVPAFAERRMSAGLPISMVPLAKYESASERIRAVYTSTTARQAYQHSLTECIDYLVIGPPERAAYPGLQSLIDASPYLFNPAFRNGALAIYAVSPGPTTSRCAR
jgi:hypothetical protein